VSRALWPGKPYSLGATWDGEGVNFALFSGTPRKSTLVVFSNADDYGSNFIFVAPTGVVCLLAGTARVNLAPDMRRSR
jgi:pullulanase/glycogen debranching enzyme